MRCIAAGHCAGWSFISTWIIIAHWIQMVQKLGPPVYQRFKATTLRASLIKTTSRSSVKFDVCFATLRCCCYAIADIQTHGAACCNVLWACSSILLMRDTIVRQKNGSITTHSRAHPAANCRGLLHWQCQINHDTFSHVLLSIKLNAVVSCCTVKY